MKHPHTPQTLSYCIAFAVAFAASHSANATSIEPPAPGDSIQYLTLRDTVMLEIAEDQSKYTRHIFEPRQTVYSLSRFYAQDIDQVYALNPALSQRAPAVGEEVKVAVPNVAITRFRTAGFSRWRHARVCYRVQPGETMYHIAKTVFRMPVDTLMALNGFKNTNLSTGQVIQVGWMSLEGAGKQVKPRELNPLRKVNASNRDEYSRQAAEQKRPLQRGVASFTPGTGDASGQLFALYAGAKPGTVLKVTNTLNNAYAYVRVIGSPPENVLSQRVDILLSGTAARVLAASERNFYVTIE